jgi:DnaD/phage-associated family protein
MPKYRKLYVKTTESLDVNDMPDDFTRLTWVLLPLALCREGRGMDNVAWIKAKLFPLRTDVTDHMILGAFEWFTDHEMIWRYEVGGRRYFCIPPDKWIAYQGNTSKEADSIFPSPIQSNARVTQEQVQSRLNHTASASASAYESESTSESESEFERPAIYAIYEREIGLLTPMVAEALKDAEKEYPLEWIEAAIGESVRNNARNWKYTEAILKRWKVEGFQTNNKTKNGKQPKRDPAAGETEEDRRRYVSGEYAEYIEH